MLGWIAMIMLTIFLGCCAIVIATSCYHIFKKIHESFSGSNNYVVRHQPLKSGNG